VGVADEVRQALKRFAPFSGKEKKRKITWKIFSNHLEILLQTWPEASADLLFACVIWLTHTVTPQPYIMLELLHRLGFQSWPTSAGAHTFQLTVHLPM